MERQPCVYILASGRVGTIYIGVTSDLIAREKQLKRWRREWKLNLIESENPDWLDLAVGLGFEAPGSDAPKSGC